MDNALNVLSSKAGFNSALRHFKTVTQYVAQVGRGVNLADLVNQSLDDGRIGRHQIKPILAAILEEKFGYAVRTQNLEQTIEDVSNIVDVLSGWSKIELVLVYHHPQTGIYVLNPKQAEAWEPMLPLVKDEFVVAYAGPASGEDVKDSVLANAAEDCCSLLNGAKIKGKKTYVSERKSAIAARPSFSESTAATEHPATTSGQSAPSSTAQTAASPASTSTARRRMTPRIPVNVTNELFHNGNVEAWKRIIESYKAKYPGYDVLIWYENERINDINALFKWGKVKHGTPIMISVVGEDPKDISKLRRYLFEGASQRFEAFLHGAVDRTLELF